MSKGEKSIKNIISSTPAGEQISFPLAVVKGESPGPTLGIAAGIHGGEYCGIEAAIRIYSLLEPVKISGQICIIPVSNLPGFMSHRMFVVPQDEKKFSQSFPGNISGSYTEKLAALIYREIIEPSDIVIEFRGGELVETMAHYVSIQRKNDKTYNTTAGERQKSLGQGISFSGSLEWVVPQNLYIQQRLFQGRLGFLQKLEDKV